MRCNSDNVGEMYGCHVCFRHEGPTLTPGVPPDITYTWVPYERANPCGECRRGFFGPSITENKYENTCTKCVKHPTLGAVFTKRTAEEEGLSSKCYTCKENGPGGTYFFKNNCDPPLVCNPDTGACVGPEGSCYDPCRNILVDLPPCHICIAYPKSFLYTDTCMVVRDNCTREWVDGWRGYYKTNFKCNTETNTCECSISECPPNKPELKSGPEWNFYLNAQDGTIYNDYGCWCECWHDYDIMVNGKEDPCYYLNEDPSLEGPFVYDESTCQCVYDASAASILNKKLMP